MEPYEERADTFAAFFRIHSSRTHRSNGDTLDSFGHRVSFLPRIFGRFARYGKDFRTEQFLKSRRTCRYPYRKISCSEFADYVYLRHVRRSGIPARHGSFGTFGHAVGRRRSFVNPICVFGSFRRFGLSVRHDLGKPRDRIVHTPERLCRWGAICHDSGQLPLRPIPSVTHYRFLIRNGWQRIFPIRVLRYQLRSESAVRLNELRCEIPFFRERG